MTIAKCALCMQLFTAQNMFFCIAGLQMLLTTHDCSKTSSLALCILTCICRHIRCLGLTPYAEQSWLLHKPCQMVCRDMASGSDSWAVKRGWVSITPLALRSDIILSQVTYIENSLIISAPVILTVVTVYHIVPMLGTRPEAP